MAALAHFAKRNLIPVWNYNLWLTSDQTFTTSAHNFWECSCVSKLAPYNFTCFTLFNVLGILHVINCKKERDGELRDW